VIGGTRREGVPLLETIERLRDEAAAIVRAALPAARTEGDLARLLAALEAAVARGLEDGRDPAGPRPACVPGCATCCTVNVGMLAAEGAVAAAWLRARLTPADAAALAARLSVFHDRVRWMEDRERIAAGATCPLLDDERRCSIHPVRPFACRAVSSLDAEDCRSAMSDAGDEDDGPPVVRMDLLQRALWEQALVSLAEGLARERLDARPRDVSGMTAIFLAADGLVPAFLAGARLPVE